MSCSSLTFRRPVLADWERIAAAPPDWWQRAAPHASLSGAGLQAACGRALLAEFEDRLLGFALVLAADDGRAPAGPDAPGGPGTASTVVAVDPGWRRSGLAGDLLARLTANGGRAGV